MSDGRYHFFVCTNQRPSGSELPSCAPAGSEGVYASFVRLIAARGYPRNAKVTATGCLTPCQVGPNVVVYPEGTWYCGVRAEDVTEILEAHLDRGGKVERLLLPNGVAVW